jgi:hypothetical protein
MKALAVVPILLSACAGALIPNYEVLPVPADSARYGVGCPWNVDVGSPQGAPAPKKLIGTAKGLATLSTASSSGAEASLKLPLIEWIAGAVGFKSSRDVVLELTDLEHHFISEPARLTATKHVLWETITARTMRMKVVNATAGALDATIVAEKLSKSGAIELSVSAAADGTYEIASKEPLVVAIRVVELARASSGAIETTIDLNPGMQGKPQKAGFEYLVATTAPAKPVSKECAVRITNPFVPQWPGDSHTFRGLEPWINPKRAFIPGNDPKLADCDFAWDSISLIFADKLAECRLQTVRQYLRIEKAGSGVQGTK